MNKLLMAFLATALLLSANCGADDSANDSKLAKEAKPGYTLLFFMNPHGKPCQQQDTILKGMKKRLDAKHVQVRYVKTTEMAAARPLFMKYGVRALPMIIVLDEKGAIKKRFSPGIHNQFALMAAID